MSRALAPESMPHDATVEDEVDIPAAVGSARLGTGSSVSGRALLGYAAAKIVPGALTFAAIPILLHALGAAQYALLSTTWALSLVASVVGVGWLRNSGLRAAGAASQAMGMLPRWSIIVAVVSPAALVGAGVAVAGYVTSSMAAPTLALTAAAFCLSDALYTVLATRAQRDLRSSRFATAESARAAVGPAVGLLLCQTLLPPGAPAVLAGYTIGTLAAVAIVSGPVRPQLVRRGHPTDVGLLRSYWSYGWPMSLWFAASVGLTYVDRILLTVLIDAETAGRYAAVADLVVRGITMVALPVGMAAHPIIMIHWNNGKRRRAMSTLRAYARILAASLVCCVAGLVLLGPTIISYLAPVSAPSAGLITLLACGAALWQCALFTQKVLEMSGRSRLMMILMILSAAVTVGVGLALIPLIGPSGSACALLIGAACYGSSCVLAGRRITPHRLGPTATDHTADNTQTGPKALLTG